MDTTVAKAFAVLEALADAGRPMRLSALTEALGLQKSNVHRLLATLIELGYVAKDPETSRYYAALKVWELGTAVISTNRLRRTISPHLQKLHELTRDTVLLAVPVGHEVLFLDRVAPARALRYTPLNGTRAPMAVTALGRVFLAAMDQPRDAVAAGLLGHRSAVRHDVGAIVHDLERVRQQGLATMDDGLMPGTRAVSAPLLSPDGRPVAAISVSAMASRMCGDHLTAATAALLSVCAEIGELTPD